MKIACCRKHQAQNEHNDICFKIRGDDGEVLSPLEVWEEIERLRLAISITLEENGYLADGENCTLIHLKRALTPNYN